MADADTTRVLLVEDDAANRRLLTLQFQALGCSVRALEDAAEALEVLRQQRHDLLVTDLFLQGERDGEWLLDAVARLPSATRPACVVLTGETSIAVHERLRVRGAMAVLVKPVRLEQLQALLLGDGATAQSGEEPHSALSATLEDCRPVLEPAVLDRALGREHLGEAHRLLELFLSGMDAVMPDIRRSLMAQDTATIRQVCHRQTGAARIIGALPCAELLNRLERSAAAGSWDHARSLAAELLQAIEQVRTVHQRLLRHADQSHRA